MTSKDRERPAKSEDKKAKGAASETGPVSAKKSGGGVPPRRRRERGARLAVHEGADRVAGLSGRRRCVGKAADDGFRRFSYAYLTAYMWGLAIVLGGVFWVTLQNLVNAKWSVVLRRLGELIATVAPVMAVLALPIVLPIFTGHDIMYAWASHEKVEADHLLHHKAGYLNPTFFLIRFVFYFGFWTLLSRFFLKQSLEQDKSGARRSRSACSARPVRG